MNNSLYEKEVEYTEDIEVNLENELELNLSYDKGLKLFKIEDLSGYEEILSRDYYKKLLNREDSERNLSSDNLRINEEYYDIANNYYIDAFFKKDDVYLNAVYSYSKDIFVVKNINITKPSKLFKENLIKIKEDQISKNKNINYVISEDDENIHYYSNGLITTTVKETLSSAKELAKFPMIFFFSLISFLIGLINVEFKISKRITINPVISLLHLFSKKESKKIKERRKKNSALLKHALNNNITEKEIKKEKVNISIEND